MSETKHHEMMREYAELMIYFSKNPEKLDECLDPKNQKQIRALLDEYVPTIKIPGDATVMFDMNSKFSTAYLSNEQGQFIVREGFYDFELYDGVKEIPEMKEYNKKEKKSHVNVDIFARLKKYGLEGKKLKKIIVLPVYLLTEVKIKYSDQEEEIVLSTC